MIRHYQNIRQLLFVLFGAGAATIFWTDSTLLVVIMFAVVIAAIGLNLYWNDYVQKNLNHVLTFKTVYDDRFVFKVRAVGIATSLGAILLFFQQGQFGLGKYFELIFGILTLIYSATLKPGGIILLKNSVLQCSGLNRDIPLNSINGFIVEEDKITIQLTSHNIYLRDCFLSEEDVQKANAFLQSARQ